MCEICDPETREQALNHNSDMAARLDLLATNLRGLGIDYPPHGDRAKMVRESAVALIRDLVADWL